MDWYINQKIVCINDDWSRHVIKNDDVLPKREIIYSIRNINSCYGSLYFRLNEIKNQENWYKSPNGIPIFGEICFLSTRFRPLINNIDTLDISVFQKLLDGINSPEKVIA